MKKLFMRLGLMFGVAFAVLSVAHAGTPQEVFYMSQPNLSNTTIIGSTASANANQTFSATVAAPTCNAGSSTFSGRNCFTNFIIQIPTTTVLSILDGATTSYTIYGAGLGTSGVNTLQINRDHLGPICTTAGNSTTFNLVNGTSVVGSFSSFNYEGYTNCGGTANKGPMQ